MSAKYMYSNKLDLSYPLPESLSKWNMRYDRIVKVRQREGLVEKMHMGKRTKSESLAHLV